MYGQKKLKITGVTNCQILDMTLFVFSLEVFHLGTEWSLKYLSPAVLAFHK